MYLHLRLAAWHKFLSVVFWLNRVAKHSYKEADVELAFMRDPLCRGNILEIMFCRKKRAFVQSPQEQRPFDHLAFKVPDIYTTVTEMKNAGINIVETPEKLYEATLVALAEDSQGIVVELIERR